MVANLQPFFGFSVCAAINAKNSYGGYTGSQMHWFLLRDGKIARVQNTERSSTCMGVKARNADVKRPKEWMS